jgi:hypothetical protein
MVLAVPPLKVVPEASPEPPLLKVTDATVELEVPAVVANNELEAIGEYEALVALAAKIVNDELIALNELEVLAANDELNTVIEDVCEFSTNAVASKLSNKSAFEALKARDADVTFPAVVANNELEAIVANEELVAVAALPEIEIPHVPDAPVPPVEGAPIELYEIVLAAEPLKVVPEASPEPPLLNVTAFVTDPADVALVAVPAVVANNELDAIVA